MEGDEKARYTNVIRFSEVVLKMARKKTAGEAGSCGSPNQRRPNKMETQCLDDFKKCA